MVTPLVGTQSAVVGTVLSRRWRLVRKLGEGGMGEVYAAEAVDGGAKAAVKVLRREFVGDPEVRARFLDEARTCMRLVHPNIVRVMDCTRAEDASPYIVMELLDGVPLGAYMQNGARIPFAQAAPIVHAILAGLGSAHASGIVHRDLKPDNIILTRDPRGAFVVKLLDFGIAKVMDVAGGMGSRTRSGVLLGTPAYMSPEQARSARDVDHRADLWSVGVLFYEMLTGRVAFAAPTEYARLAALLSSEAEPVDHIDPALSPLRPFLERALRKNRDERFQSATEMAQALAAIPAPAVRSDWAPGRAANLGADGVPPSAMVAGSAGEEGQHDPMTTSGVNRRHGAELGGPFKNDEPSGPLMLPSRKGKGGTLASHQAGVAIDPPPLVLFVEAHPLGGTLPSEVRTDRRSTLPPASRGVAPKVVILFVTVALALGLVLGWLMSRMQ